MPKKSFDVEHFKKRAMAPRCPDENSLFCKNYMFSAILHYTRRSNE